MSLYFYVIGLLEERRTRMTRENRFVSDQFEEAANWTQRWSRVELPRLKMNITIPFYMVKPISYAHSHIGAIILRKEITALQTVRDDTSLPGACAEPCAARSRLLLDRDGTPAFSLSSGLHD